MLEFIELDASESFNRKGKSLFITRLSHFLNCEIEFIDNPIQTLKESFEIELPDPIENLVIKLNDESIILLGYILEEEKTIAIFGIKITGNILIQYPEKLLCNISKIISNILSDLCKKDFQDALLYLGDAMLKKIVGKCIGNDEYKLNTVLFLLDYLEKLKSITFENKHFSTGMIVSNLTNEYTNKGENFRTGNLYSLKETFNLVQEVQVDKRKWLLVDGNTSFYLTDKHLSVDGLFIRSGYDQGAINFVDSYTLSKTLYGGDIALRVMNHNLYSIVTSNGFEYVNIENCWKLRNYDYLVNFFKTQMEVSHEFANTLLFFIIYASQQNLSSVIWIPDEIESMQEHILSAHKFVHGKVSIFDPHLKSTIIRFLESDGVTIFEKDGTVPYFASIVNLSDVKIEGISGTGENATKLLSQNGMAIKISQDGSIKIFYDFSKEPLDF